MSQDVCCVIEIHSCCITKNITFSDDKKHRNWCPWTSLIPLATTCCRYYLVANTLLSSEIVSPLIYVVAKWLISLLLVSSLLVFRPPVRVSPATLPGTGCHHNWIIVVPKYVAANGFFWKIIIYLWYWFLYIIKCIFNKNTYHIT